MSPRPSALPATIRPDDSPDPRLAASFHRLQAADYDAAPVLRDGADGAWPGDYPGRLVLALSRLASVTHAEPRQLGPLVEELPGRLNRRGYLGPVHSRAVDEQQLAGHGWLVSGLLAHHRLTGDDRSRTLALDIAHRLFLPAVRRLADYPRRRPGDAAAGGASGSVVGREGRWLLSSDTYCVFIALEGLVAAYAATRDREFADAVEAMRHLVDRDDLLAARAQLHATLTAGRCLHAFYELTGSTAALATARRVYELYAVHGRTANHATWNWFGRADSWTEPCAVTDSLILALGLWRTTGERRYLDDAHAIEHNGLGHAQKPHGGFGLDSVAGPGRPWLTCVHPDAAWCCTMRGAIGLTEARERGYSFLDGSTAEHGGTDVLSVDLYRDGTTLLKLPHGKLVLRQRTEYPVGGRTVLEVLDSDVHDHLCISFTLPSWTDPGRVTTVAAGRDPAELPGRLVTVPAAGDRYSVDFPVELRGQPETGKGAAGPVTLRHGPLLLGAEGGRDADPVPLLPSNTEPVEAARARYRHRDRMLSPVRDAFDRTASVAAAYRAQVVFDPREP